MPTLNFESMFAQNEMKIQVASELVADLKTRIACINHDPAYNNLWDDVKRIQEVMNKPVKAMFYPGEFENEEGGGDTNV